MDRLFNGHKFNDYQQSMDLSFNYRWLIKNLCTFSEDNRLQEAITCNFLFFYFFCEKLHASRVPNIVEDFYLKKRGVMDEVFAKN